MTSLAERCPPSDLPERMEREDLDPELLARALDALERANRRYGGTRAVWRPVSRGLERRPPASGRVRLLDVGAGGGDMARELGRRIRRLGLRPDLLLGDRHAAALRLARRRGRPGAPGREPDVAADVGPGPDAGRLLRLSADRLPLRDDGVDLVVCATTLHHLGRAEARRFLREADRVARMGWVVADLRRSWPAYLAVQLLARTAWRNNPLPRADGPRSVRRAFTVSEARELLREAGLPAARARAAPPFRLTLLGGEALAP